MTNFDPNADYYAALGVSDSASPAEIKKAYRRLAKEYHPDTTGGDKAKEARFKEITSAYEVLGDAAKRQQYDAFRAAPGGNGFGGFGGFGGGGGFGGFDLGDLFSQVFSGGAPGARDGPGGVRFSFYSDQAGPEVSWEQRPPTGGRARRRARKRQARADRRPREFTVRASDGSKLTQKDHHIYSDVRVQLDEAVLGTVVEVPTLQGKASVKIPPGTSSGAKLRLKGKGAPRPGGKRGDHYLTVQIDVPKQVDEKAEKLLVDFMRRTKRSKKS